MRELVEGESMAQRVLIYPREWDEKGADGEGSGAHRETSRRLLRKAAREYKVMLQPIDAIPSANSSGLLSEEERYPLTILLSLLHYNRVLLLQAPGLILDSTPLDLLFTLPMETPMLGLAASQEDKSQPSILLLQPSRDTYQEIASSLPEGVYPDSEFLQRVTLESAPTDPKYHTRLLAETGLLGDESVASFNTTQFLDTTGYVRLSDTGLPGPEYDIPRQDFIRAMPSGKQARKAWETVYERYRDQRMDVCGLDLEPVEEVRHRNGDGNGDAEELK